MQEACRQPRRLEKAENKLPRPESNTTGPRQQYSRFRACLKAGKGKQRGRGTETAGEAVAIGRAEKCRGTRSQGTRS
eukprot:238417-Chlamydomonas_euryale.AAC.1